MLATGSYVVDRAWPDGVSLRGRCARETLLRADGGAERLAVVEIEDHASAIRIDGVTIGPTPLRAVSARNGGAAVTLDGLLVSGATGLATQESPGEAAVLATDGATIQARSLVVRDTQPDAAGQGGAGAAAADEGRLELRRAVLSGNRVAGVLVGERGVVVAEDVAVRDNRSREADDLDGGGIEVIGAGRVEARRVLAEGNQFGGIILLSGAEAVLEDIVSRDNRSLPSGRFGRGIAGAADVRVELRRALLERNRDQGLTLGGPARAPWSRTS